MKVCDMLRSIETVLKGAVTTEQECSQEMVAADVLWALIGTLDSEGWGPTAIRSVVQTTLEGTLDQLQPKKKEN